MPKGCHVRCFHEHVCYFTKLSKSLQDVLKSLKEQKQNLGRLFIFSGMSMGAERMELHGSLHTCLLKRIHMI